jgi:hypothetical protein
MTLYIFWLLVGSNNVNLKQTDSASSNSVGQVGTRCRNSIALAELKLPPPTSTSFNFLVPVEENGAERLSRFTVAPKLAPHQLRLYRAITERWSETFSAHCIAAQREPGFPLHSRFTVLFHATGEPNR